MDYSRIGPHHAFLSDEAVLMQAWKKTHAYIRRHNWYADTLELDLSTVTLRETVQSWTEQFSIPRVCEYRPQELRLVPAPKAASWHTPGHRPDKWNPQKDWRPEGNDNNLRLRPLGHVRLRDQVIATAVMICLADCIESVQHATVYSDVPPEKASEKARRNGVVSYGNRLLCQWHDDLAIFGWGNAQTYRKYYTDYRAFVRRPTDIAESLGVKNVAIVQLDLQGFYDRVNRKHLLNILRNEAKSFYPSHAWTREFWEIVERVFAWRWHRADQKWLPEEMAEHPDRGLPQGLVASGFFANAYLLPFDRWMQSCCKGAVSGYDWRIHDYCRYVDDLRLVVTYPVSCSGRMLAAQISEWVNKQLRDTAPQQRINPKKTAVSFINRAAMGIRVAPAMEAIQEKASGPTDHEACTQILQELDGLFPLAEQAAFDRWAKATRDGKEVPYDVPKKETHFDPEKETEPAVLDLFVTDLDVKPETLERFAANRWRTAFRNIRGYTDGCTGKNQPSAELQALDERAMLFAKRLIRRWIQDPSLVALLRVAMDVFPSTQNLKVVLDLLKSHIEGPHRKCRQVCYYVAAELMRAGATETGFCRDSRGLPRDADIIGYRKTLAKFGSYCLKRAVPWYVQQQALLLLATRMKRPPILKDLGSSKRLLDPYLNLHALITLKAKRVRPPVDQYYYYVLAHHVTHEPVKIAERFADALEMADVVDAVMAFDRLFQADRDIAVQVWRLTKGGKRHLPWRKRCRAGRVLRQKKQPMPGGGFSGTYRLDKIMRWDPNPLQQENAAVMFLRQLLEGDGDYSPDLTPNRIELTCRDWSRILDPRLREDRNFLTVRILPSSETAGSAFDVQYAPPHWCPPEMQRRLSAGRILRAAVVGDEDYSIHYDRPSLIIGPYRGVRTNWYKRQFGMSQSPESLAGPDAPMSPWLGELLMALLRWPGARSVPRGISNWRQMDTSKGLAKILDQRLVHQEKLFGVASHLPIYSMDVFANRTARSQAMTVVMAQTVLPRYADYDAHKHDLTLNNPEFRIKHARHLATVARLIEQVLHARATFDCRSHADLIVLPELSVHLDDLPILERLVDRTGAMVFCGLVFHQRRGNGPLVNEAMWLIPDYRPDGRTILRYMQGKQHMTKTERRFHITPHRPYQRIIQGLNADGISLWRMSGAICYDATDLRLAADLRDKTDAFVVPALNKDIPTFDHMVEALHYHMYQHFILVNTGEFGGSTAQAPYKERHLKQIVHCHGVDQIAISICEMDLTDCIKARTELEDAAGEATVTDNSTNGNGRPEMKYPPAGFCREKTYYV